MVIRKIISLTLMTLFALVLIQTTAYANDSEHIPMVTDTVTGAATYITRAAW